MLELFGRHTQRVANLHSYHGAASASRLVAGAIVADRFAVRLDPIIGAGAGAHLRPRRRRAPGIEVAYGAHRAGRAVARPDGWAAELGDHIALVDATIRPAQTPPGRRVQVLVRWYVPVGAPPRTTPRSSTWASPTRRR